jgi:hypothetical protein
VFVPSALAGEVVGTPSPEEQYVEAMWQQYFYRTQASLPKLDVDLIRRVALTQQPSKAQWKSWMLLGMVQDPPQLAFLAEVASKWGARDNWPCLAMEIVKLVKTPDDEKTIRPLLEDEKLLPELLEAVLRTTDEGLLKSIFAEKNGERDYMGSRVTNYARRRRKLGLPIDPQMAEPFMKARVRRIGPPSAAHPAEALLAADLGYDWSVGMLMNVVLWMPLPTPFGKLTEEQKQMAQMEQKAQLEWKRLTLEALQKVVQEDFGANGTDMTVEQLQAACAKAKAWWTKNSKETKYRLQPEKQSPTHPAPASAPAPAAGNQ